MFFLSPMPLKNIYFVKHILDSANAYLEHIILLSSSSLFFPSPIFFFFFYFIVLQSTVKQKYGERSAIFSLQKLIKIWCNGCLNQTTPLFRNPREKVSFFLFNDDRIFFSWYIQKIWWQQLFLILFFFVSIS